eukprot:TRINITY_DN1897_c0_g1_i3.p1 TRINITY_DN1897_c0_g1~~TRINITY_DN1897_c0_g1_i3.p1  ORF type:complete len:362 (+),score=56.23 TRINITY_DN1897_c0_g1_i3:31-1086(+)
MNWLKNNIEKLVFGVRQENLTEYIQRGDLHSVMILLQSDPDNKSFWYRKNGKGPLITAISSSQFAILDYLLENGGSVTETEVPSGKPFIQYVLESGNVDLLKKVVMNESIYYSLNGDRENLFIMAMKLDDTHIKGMIIDLMSTINDVDPLNHVSNLRESVLILAIKEGNHEVFDLMISLGVDIDKCIGGHTSLHCAVQYNYPYAVSYLVNNGKLINATLNDGTTPLHIACNNGNCSIIQLLLHSSGIVIVQCRNNSGDMPIHCLVAFIVENNIKQSNEMEDTFKMLLDYELRYDTTKNEPRSLYRIFEIIQHVEAIEWMVNILRLYEGTTKETEVDIQICSGIYSSNTIIT